MIARKENFRLMSNLEINNYSSLFLNFFVFLSDIKIIGIDIWF